MVTQAYELTEAPNRDHDYTVRETNAGDRPEEDIEIYRAWQAADSDWTLVVEEGCPAVAREDIEASSGFADIVTTADAEAETVKEVDMDVCERIAFYVETPPETRYHDVDEPAAIDLMERRELWDEANVYEDSWYYPEKDEVVVQFRRQGTHKSVSRLEELDDVDREILAGDYRLNGEDDETLRDRIEARATDLAEDTFYSEREAQAIAIRELDLTNQRGADALSMKRTNVNQYVTRAKRKYAKVQRSFEAVDGEDVFEDRRGSHWQNKRGDDDAE